MMFRKVVTLLNHLRTAHKCYLQPTRNKTVRSIPTWKVLCLLMVSVNFSELDQLCFHERLCWKYYRLFFSRRNSKSQCFQKLNTLSLLPVTNPSAFFSQGIRASVKLRKQDPTQELITTKNLGTVFVAVFWGLLFSACIISFKLSKRKIQVNLKYNILMKNIYFISFYPRVY